MWAHVGWFIFGFILLCAGGHYFVEGSIILAKRFGLSALWVGVVVVGFVTTLPEFLLTCMSLWQGHMGLALGNPIGSYIANMGLVLGLTALYKPLRISKRLLHYELPSLFVLMLLCALVFGDGFFSRKDAVLLFIALIVFVIFLIRQIQKFGETTLFDSIESERKISWWWLISWLIGFLCLWIGAQAVIKGSMGLASSFGISDLIIGLTMVALGTSLPELAASFASARKGQDDLVLGNVIGSNALCILGVMPLVGIWHPSTIQPEILQRDFWAMLVITIVFAMAAYGGRKQQEHYVISRFEGLILLFVYGVYGWFIVTT